MKELILNKFETAIAYKVASYYMHPEKTSYFDKQLYFEAIAKNRDIHFKALCINRQIWKNR